MKVYGAISSSHAEDAPLLHNTHTKADEKKPPLFKGALATSSRKTIALAVAGVAACGAVAIVANTGSAPAFGRVHKLGDALDDAKAGKKERLLFQFDLSRFDSNARRMSSSSYLFSRSISRHYVAKTSDIAASLSIRKHHYFRVSTTLGGDV